MSLFFKFLVLFLILFFVKESQAQFKPAEQQYLGETNISVNGGFEQGKTNWTNVNGTFSVGSTNKLFGQNAGCVTLTAQSLDLKNVSTTTSMSGLQGYVNAYVKTNFPAQLCSIVDNIETTCENIPYDNTYKQIQIPTVLGSTTLGVKLKSTSQTGTICVDNASFGTAKLTQDIAQSEFAFSVNIGGANVPITTIQSAYTEIISSSLDMVVNKASGTMQIPCSSTNSSTGLTCSVGSESIGVVFDAQVGDYEICAEFSTYNQPSVLDAYSAFQLVETPNNAQTILQEGKTRIASGGNAISASHVWFTPVNICGFFKFETSGQKTIRLMYEKNFSSQINLIIDRLSTFGQRDMHIHAKYWPPKSKIIAESTTNIARSLGTLTWASSTNCLWQNTKTTSFVGYSADADCNNPTASTYSDISHSGTKTPHFILPAGSPRGSYKVTVNGNFINRFVTDNIVCFWRFSDGTNHSTQGSAYVANVDLWDSSKEFILNINSDLSSATTFNLQSGNPLAGGGGCDINNLPYTGGLNQFAISVDYIPYDKTALIVGEFEQIKTTDLCTIEAYSNDADVISADTEDIPFKTVDSGKDSCNLWSNAGNTGANTKDAYTARVDGYIILNAYVSSGTAIASFYTVYKNGTFANINCGYNGTNAFVPMTCVVPVSKNDVITLRNTQNITLTSSVNHKITITELPDLAGIVKNLNDYDFCEDAFECTDVYSARISSTGIISNENLDWINGNCSISTSTATCNLNPNIFTSPPTCVWQSRSGGASRFDGATATTSTISATGWTVAGTSTALDGFIICSRSTDFMAKTSKAAVSTETFHVPNITAPKVCYYAFGGTSATLVSPTECTTGTCVEVYDNCGSASPPARSSEGSYTDLTFASGTWKASSFLKCDCISHDATTGTQRSCDPYFITGDNTWSTNSNGGAVLNFFANDGANVGRDGYITIECKAEAP